MAKDVKNSKLVKKVVTERIKIYLFANTGGQMKLMAVLVSFLLAQSALAYEVKTCSQLMSEKSQLVLEMNYLSDKINSSTNSDVIEFYIEQYEALYSKYQGLKASLDDTCK